MYGENLLHENGLGHFDRYEVDYFWCQFNRNELHYPIIIEKTVNRRWLN